MPSVIATLRMLAHCARQAARATRDIRVCAGRPRRPHSRDGVMLLAAWVWSCAALGAGTEAGRSVVNRAELRYQMAGGTALDASSEVRTPVDELLDVTVVSVLSGAVAVTSPASDAVLEFVVTNTGNGTEPFRLAALDVLAGDDFDPDVITVYLESNGAPGLQIGPGGDAEYITGSNDPVLAPDGTQRVYVASTIPAGLAQNALGTATLRAVADTIVRASGTADPQAAAFPLPGATFAGLGDPADGGGNVDAVVGNAHDRANLLLEATAAYQVSAAVVDLAKRVLRVEDPGGGTEIRTGSILTYQIAVSVTGTGSADGIVITDPLPAELDYRPGTLSVTALAPGEEIDDDFLPAGADNTGYDASSRTLTARLGSQPAGAAAIAIEFQATVR
ncbi:MAG: hypothetical protein AAGI15_04495 [Pseudomonadota bacterium]